VFCAKALYMDMLSIAVYINRFIVLFWLIC